MNNWTIDDFKNNIGKFIRVHILAQTPTGLLQNNWTFLCEIIHVYDEFPRDEHIEFRCYANNVVQTWNWPSGVEVRTIPTVIQDYSFPVSWKSVCDDIEKNTITFEWA